METRKKNYRETMAILFDLGESYEGEQFAIRFQSGKYGRQEFWCKYEDGEYEHCEMVDERHVLCTLPGVDAEGLGGHGLRYGVLNYELMGWLPNSAGGEEWTLLSKGDVVCKEQTNEGEEDEEGNPVEPEYVEYKIELTSGAGTWTGVSVGAWELIGPIMKGEAGPAGGTFEDAPEEGGPWARQGGEWVPAGNDLGLKVIDGEICITYNIE